MAQPISVRQLYQRARAGGAPLVGGHRGNPAEQPENTLASFRSAIELGVDMIECDVHLSSDGELVVIHDHTLDRTTNGTGLVWQHTLAELRELDAGAGERLPILAEVCELAREGAVGLCVEIKQIPIPYPGLEEKLTSELEDLGMLDQTAVISFHHGSVKRVKELEPRLSTGVLEGARPLDPAGIMKAALADLYAPHFGAMDAELVEDVHSAGGAVGVWTVDDGAAIAWCKICRPDSVFTNRPREVLPAFTD
ncbi:MAG: glycerophosphodiester phosphodiesterase [Candidatus Nephthysia bennettiae]|uniref:Glycerophosphodiester phosphodiesterase n=1 Tax=Candidatus Nephthysia bennettiae TaxID=3127016 RepID=A0A934K849_9BACT|nr:glycerophosphodiester phosphodiesterase [Candidatus Dormibacteraeota bacterium]MBJ7613067.1 glycerophosphodiester phosphodiesterase [Candidatus Dormibacteraeota bacterium]PZR84766.1 MAG: glycerophosphodiester phosphodiesterase [Candidatus Dormibacteraeota bacterium]